MLFEWSFRAGDILTLLGGIFVASAFLYRRGGEETTLRLTLKDLSLQFSGMQLEIKKLADVITRMAVTDVRLTNLEQDMRELRHGRGFIQGARKVGGIDGEYP